MEVISTPEGKSSVRLEIVMPADTVAAAIGTAVRAVAQRSKIPGFRPGKAPRAVVERLNSEVNKIIRGKDMEERLRGDGVSAAGGTPEALHELIRRELTMWREVVRVAGIKVQ